jgi:hypothetical protein
MLVHLHSSATYWTFLTLLATILPTYRTVPSNFKFLLQIEVFHLNDLYIFKLCFLSEKLLVAGLLKRHLNMVLLYIKSVKTCHAKLALSKTINLQLTLGDRNNFLPSILVPVSYKSGKRCNIILVDVVMVHVSLAKTERASNNPIQTQPVIFQVTNVLYNNIM